MRSDTGSLVGAIASFFVFIVSIYVLYTILTNMYSNFNNTAYAIINGVRNMVGENIKFLNNQTSYLSPNINILNNGNKVLDLSCFRLYVNGFIVNFNYSVNQLYPSNLLLPGEDANITFPNIYLKNASWNYIALLSCYGNRFQTLIYVS
ncbi:MAG: hypothetical protein ACPLX8_00190 [Nanopusillaceae archaeon]